MFNKKEDIEESEKGSETKEAYQESKKKKEPQREGSFFGETFRIVFWALVIAMFVRVFLFQPFFVKGSSMVPNFHDGEYIIINEFGYKKVDLDLGDKEIAIVKPFRELKRGEVVVFQYPKDPDQYFIKRIIGLPGEKIEIKDGKVFVYNQENPEGFVLNESDYLPTFVTTSANGQERIFQLNDREYLVFGDNRSASHDSRAWGPLDKDYIIGKVFIRVFPFGDFKIFTN